MPVCRCNACGLIAEDITARAGDKAVCTKCGAATTLFATPFYVQKLVERYLATRRELDALKAELSRPDDEAPDADESARPTLLNEEDLGNTVLLATEAQHEPLKAWFKARQVEATFRLEAVDTTGYFDEAAHEIAAHYEPLQSLLEQVRFAYRQEFSWINVELGRREPQVRDGILTFCRQLYAHTLFTRYGYNKQTQVLGLGIQPAQTVRDFFLGSWLEWHVLGTLLQLCVARRVEFSCARNAKVDLQNDVLRELDVAVLIGGRTLVVVECKTGEFRADIHKYSKLRQRLGLQNSQFILCNPDLPDAQLAGLGAMHALTFTNLRTLRSHLEHLV